MKYSTENLNRANKITLYSDLFGTYTIDKTNRTIIEYRNEKVSNITEKCKAEYDRFVSEGLIDTVKYNCGVVFWKILNKEADKECKIFLNNFDSIVTE